MLIVTIVLFLLPGSLLWATWRRSTSNAREDTASGWREYCGTAALIAASCATLLELAFFFSYFHKGGSPHGMMPSPGLWSVLGKIAGWTFVGGVVLGTLGKGRWRLMYLAWAVALPFVAFALFMLERD